METIPMSAELWRTVLDECELGLEQLELFCQMLINEVETKESVMKDRFKTHAYSYTLANVAEELFM